MSAKKILNSIFVLAVCLCMLTGCTALVPENAKDLENAGEWDSMETQKIEVEDKTEGKSETENEAAQEPAWREETDAHTTVEAMYQYTNYNFEWTGEKRDMVMLDTRSCDSLDMSVEEQEDFIRQYLEERGLSYDEPAGSTWEEDYDVLWFWDDKTERLALVIWSYFTYYPDGESEAASGTSVWCTSFLFEDMEEVGRIARTELGENTYEEVFYDPWGEELAGMTYTCEEGIPFAMVNAYEAEEGLGWLEPFVFCRNHKFRLDEKKVLWDEEGRFAGYRGELNIWRGWGSDSCVFSSEYDEQGRLCAINDIWHEWDLEEAVLKDASGGFIFTYRENGSPLELSYWHSSITGSGTWDSSGRIYYDKLGRMAYSSHYITHGRHYRYYLYKNEEEQPWLILEFCSMAYSVDENGWGYGHEVQAFLFESFMVQ